MHPVPLFQTSLQPPRTGYYYLNQVQAPVNLLSVIDTSLIHIHRLVLYAFMTCSEIAGPAREVRGRRQRQRRQGEKWVARLPKVAFGYRVAACSSDELSPQLYEGAVASVWPAKRTWQLLHCSNLLVL